MKNLPGKVVEVVVFLLIGFSASLIFTGCGGGSGGASATPPPTTVPTATVVITPSKVTVVTAN